MNKLTERLSLAAQNPDIFKQFNRGIERETLRYNTDGSIATTPHPSALGSATFNQWITTDFAESLLEFITPVSQNVDTIVDQLSDVHHFSQSHLSGDEKLWPMSMPCYVPNEDAIQLAQYGTSNNGRMKTLYREGLKRRYGSLMQIISGVHFNFSFPEALWDQLYGDQTQEAREKTKSDSYFGLIRNYYRFGWLIPYFFGASPAICPSFLKGRDSQLPFENVGKTLYLPYATSLRLSDLGYTNSAQSGLKIGFNSLEQYLEGVHSAIRTPSAEFADIGVKVDGEYRQLNSNVLQIENELYAPIRPKRVASASEKPSEALQRGGVEYIEIRSLDVNPFSPIGVNKDQIRFLDLFLTWAVMSESDEMTNCELECWRSNWNKVVIEGRKPGLELKIGCHGEVLTLNTWAHRVMDELFSIAELFDKANGGNEYSQVCQRLTTWIDDPELTLSAQFLTQLKQEGCMISLGSKLGNEYAQQNKEHQYSQYSGEEMQKEVELSLAKQAEADNAEEIDFDTFLENYFSDLK
ncbi:glutamate--cysteine ligase [Vibrio sp. RC27]